MSPIPTTIGPYRVERELARGGMGVVYLARDTRLGRAVALKALSDDFISDPDRLLRFEREAKVLASLSHPNVAGIYGVEESEGRRYLALEYVEGESLAARVARGPLAPEDTVEVCHQIAAGIEAAHEGGIIHRDLKPGNVMIRPSGEVKVVDFGLAKGKVVEWEESLDSPTTPDSPTVTDSPALAHSPTVGSPDTLPGVILGTAAYLSPEQARGRPVDRRTDIWSFGCVLYECLTGRRAFGDESVSDVIARILRGDVDWERLPRSTPPALRSLLQRCLEKDPRKRLRDMGDARLALEEIREGKAAGGEAAAAPAPRALSPRVIVGAVALLILGVAAGIAIWNSFGPGHEARFGSGAVRRFSIALPPEVRWSDSPDSKGFTFSSVVISPDGRFLIKVGTPRTKEGEPAARPRLYRRRLDGERFEAVEGSEGATGFLISPDGRWLYFIAPISERAAGLRIMKVATEGGMAPLAVTNWDPSWENWVTLDSEDLLITGKGGSEFVRVRADGSPPSAPIRIVTPPNTGFGGFRREGLPGGRGVLVDIGTVVGGEAKAGVGVLDPRTGKVKPVLLDGAMPMYSPTGHLLFTRRSTLLAVPFDLKRLEIRGEPVAITDGLRSEIMTEFNASFSLSKDGTLAYLPGGIIGEHRRLIVVDGQGHVSDWSPERAFFAWTINANPGGDRIACIIPPQGGFWVSERGKRAARRVFNPPDAAACNWPEFSFDGKRIAFNLYGDSTKEGVYVMPSDGSGQPRKLCRPTPPSFFGKIAWLGDGSSVLGTLWRTITNFDIVRIPVDSATNPSSPGIPLLAAPDCKEWRAVSSPDGRWIAYTSNETGSDEIYVVPYRPDGSLGASRVVSVGGGVDPCWGRDGKQVFYRSPQRRVMSVPLTFQPSLTAGRPVSRWDLDQLRVIDDGGTPYDLLPGDQMVAIQRGEDEGEATRVEVVLNFFEELKQKMRAAGKR